MNHFHIGDINFNKENIVFMYYLYQKIQYEMFELLPKSRRSSVYCKYIPELNIDIKYLNQDNPDYKYFINFYYGKIVKFITKRLVDPKKYNKKTQHPQGFKCQYDHSAARYCWVNFVPAIFNTRGNKSYTIEFRMASGGSSYIKNKNWLLICMGLVDIIENHKGYILSNPEISLKDIINVSYGDKGAKIIDFINERILLFSEKDSTKNKKLEELDYIDNELDENLSMKSL